jgi:hypothetical protein
MVFTSKSENSSGWYTTKIIIIPKNLSPYLINNRCNALLPCNFLHLGCLSFRTRMVILFNYAKRTSVNLFLYIPHILRAAWWAV